MSKTFNLCNSSKSLISMVSCSRSYSRYLLAATLRTVTILSLSFLFHSPRIHMHPSLCLSCSRRCVYISTALSPSPPPPPPPPRWLWISVCLFLDKSSQIKWPLNVRREYHTCDRRQVFDALIFPWPMVNRKSQRTRATLMKSARERVSSWHTNSRQR